MMYVTYIFFVWLYLSAIAATSFGLFISAIANSEITATLTVPLILIPQIILGGDAALDWVQAGQECWHC